MSNQTIENATEEYMKHIKKIEAIIAKAKTEKNLADPARQSELDERIEDVEAIHKQLVSRVIKGGISRDILEETARLLSIF